MVGFIRALKFGAVIMATTMLVLEVSTQSRAQTTGAESGLLVSGPCVPVTSGCWQQIGRQRARHKIDPGLSWAQEFPALRSLHRAITNALK